jgi:NACHT domain
MVRQKLHERVKDQCGTMFLLGTSKAVELGDIYTDLNVLDRITSDHRKEVPELLEDFNPEIEDFDQPGFSRMCHKRLPGLDVVLENTRLLILGKPGSGKITFLKWLALKCSLEEFQSNQVPIFIQLKDFAKNIRKKTEEYTLLDYICNELKMSGIESAPEIKKIFVEGRALVLLDGLDEVLESDDSVISQIRQFVNHYFRNRYIVTCRIAGKKYSFYNEKFVRVEVADFSMGQIEKFSRKWFVVNSESKEKGEEIATQFTKKLIENSRIKEIAITPILLNLTCLFFQDKRSFPTKKSKLYEEGLEILLRKWDEERGVERDEVYRSLSLEHKVKLLSYVAITTFEQGFYFFEKSKVEELIADYLRDLPDLCDSRLSLKESSKIVLRSIEAQHGLFVERSRGIYSFSHLTFQEYFTARAFVDNPTPKVLRQLVGGLRPSSSSRGRWYETLLLVYGMLENTADLVRVKLAIDEMVKIDEKLQQFLTWVNSKSLLVQSSYNPVATRAFYFGLDYLELGLACALDNNLKQNLEQTCLSEDLFLDLALVEALREYPVSAVILPSNTDFLDLHSLEILQRLQIELEHLVQEIPDLRNLLNSEIEQRFHNLKTTDLRNLLNSGVEQWFRYSDSTMLHQNFNNQNSSSLRDLEKLLLIILERDILSFNDLLKVITASESQEDILIQGFAHELGKVPEINLLGDLGDLKDQLRAIIYYLRRYQFADLYDSITRVKSRWGDSKRSFNKRLITFMREHRNIKHDWQFTDNQKILLQQYYDANKLLVDCLNTGIEDESKEEIEKMLILPVMRAS